MRQFLVVVPLRIHSGVALRLAAALQKLFFSNLLDAFAQKLDGGTARTQGGGTVYFRTVQSDDSCKALEGIIDTLTVIDGMLWLAGLVLPVVEVAAAVVLIFIGFLMLVDPVYC